MKFTRLFLKSFSVRVVRKLIYLSKYLLSFPVALALFILFPIFKVRLVKLFSDRIGHYAMNTELFLSALENVENKREKYLFYTCQSPVKICNSQLHIMWKRIIPIVPFPVIAFQADKFLLRILGVKYKPQWVRRFEQAEGYQDTSGLLKKCKNHLSFTEAEYQQAKALKNQFGLPDNAKYICLLARDASYLSKQFPESNWSYHDFRDSDISTYKKAVLYLAEKGYFVIRMGKWVEKELGINHPNVIDYAVHPQRSDFMDIYLSAHCHFFISTCSGLDAIPQIFRKPVMFVNVAPFHKQLQYWYPCEVFIVKKVMNSNRKLLSFKEINSYFDATSGSVEDALRRNNLSLLNNTEDEILAATIEMDERLRGSWSEKQDDLSLQERFKKLLPLVMITDNDQLISDPSLFYPKLGAHFLSEHQELLSGSMVDKYDSCLV